MTSQLITETRLAHLSFRDAGILVIRFKYGVPLDLEGVVEVLEERIRVSAGTPRLVCTILPQDLDADIKVSVTDHGRWVKKVTLAEATVAPSIYQSRLAGLYYVHFPQPFPTNVFVEEQEAMAWLEAQIKVTR
jgi:hypothetical protein